MIIKVLGSAAGGGFPQLNCTCRNCAAARAGEPGFTARTQSSLAASSDGEAWVLFNASPDLRQQVAVAPELAPPAGAGPRASPIKAVVLTNGDVDHIAGLLSLREGFSFTLYAAAPVLGTLQTNSIFNVLDPALVARVALDAAGPTALSGPGGDVGLSVEAFPVPGKIALYLENPTAGEGLGTRDGDTVGLEISDARTGSTFFYIPGCAAVDEPLAARLRGAALVLFDGTLYTDGEMIVQVLSHKTGKRMGHISMSGPDGSIAALQKLGIRRRVFVHINNSNPVLHERSPERAAVERAGWEVAFDGMEIRL
jgi:pyrroloquinoline quinone biosynthesis protein B